MAKKSIISVRVSASEGDLFLNVEGAGEIKLHLPALSDEIRERALYHGLIQKISDGAAIPKADLPADPVEAAKAKFDAMTAIAQRLIDGDWSKRAEGGSGPVAGIILRAFTEFALARAAKAKNSDVTAETVKAVYDAKTKSEQLALRNVPEIAAIIERIKSERGAASATVDTDSLLGELGL